MSELPQRKRPAHFATLEHHNRAIIVFLTVCTANRQPLLANAAAHSHLRTYWAPANKWRVGRYVLMPDHLHLFCSPAEWPAPPLGAWVSYWKSRTAATWPGETVGRIWQRDAWDTQLRVGDSYSEKWEYVRQNPVRAGLAQSIEEWPYQGEMDALRWHD